MNESDAFKTLSRVFLAGMASSFIFGNFLSVTILVGSCLYEFRVHVYVWSLIPTETKIRGGSRMASVLEGVSSYLRRNDPVNLVSTPGLAQSVAPILNQVIAVTQGPTVPSIPLMPVPV